MGATKATHSATSMLNILNRLLNRKVATTLSRPEPICYGHPDAHTSDDCLRLHPDLPCAIGEAHQSGYGRGKGKGIDETIANGHKLLLGRTQHSTADGSPCTCALCELLRAARKGNRDWRRASVVSWDGTAGTPPEVVHENTPVGWRSVGRYCGR